MPRKPSPYPNLRQRFTAAEERSGKFQSEGLPIPTDRLREELEAAIGSGDAGAAEAVVKRIEALVARADQDWGWLRELLQRVDTLRAIADTVGLDLALVDARVGNPRALLVPAELSPTSLEKAAASASFALAVLNDAIPKFIVAEAEALGTSIRRARDRGEDVRSAVVAFTALLRALQEPILAATADRLTETRKAVARIPRAPAVAAVSSDEEEEILREARNLARRLHRIKGRAHDATQAVRLISQVRSALSEDRRFSPEEEVEALWAEVDRLADEKRLATAGPPLEEGVPARDDEAPAEEAPEEPSAAGPPEAEEPVVTRAPQPPRLRPPAPPPAVTPSPISRLPPPMVPPMNPLPDEGFGVPPPASPDTLAEGAGPRSRRPTRIAIAAAYVPPDLSGAPAPAPAPAPSPAPAAEPEKETAPTAEPETGPGVLPPPSNLPRRTRSRHHEL